MKVEEYVHNITDLCADECDDIAAIKLLKQYANQRVIEELKKAWEEIEKDFYLTSAVYFERRIKELKQE